MHSLHLNYLRSIFFGWGDEKYFGRYKYDPQRDLEYRMVIYVGRFCIKFSLKLKGDSLYIYITLC